VVRQNVAAARTKIAEAHERIKRLNDQLDSMRADRRMADYIRERHQSTDYTQRLGIISRVRSDLRHLSTLLRNVRQEAGQEEFNKEMKSRQKEKDDKRKEQGKPELFPRIDRIVLFIDDLDRCPEKNVVDVLQAVHLLLAFPLFVVVVGVDPRWLLHSLRQHSRVFQNDELENGAEGPLEEEGHWKSTPLNYLEKIFQNTVFAPAYRKRGFGNIVDTFARSEQKPVANSSEVFKPNKEEATKTSPVIDDLESHPTALDLKPNSDATPPPSTSESGGQTRANEPVVQLQSPASQQLPLSPVVDRNPDQLQIQNWERSLMKQLDEFIPTPRAGKRSRDHLRCR
jgi:hypothetical protein